MAWLLKRPPEAPLASADRSDWQAGGRDLQLGGGLPGKKKLPVGSRTWFQIDVSGGTQTLECDRQHIIRRTHIPARDLRVLGPLFTHSASILGRGAAMIVSLEFIKAIVTADEVLVLDVRSSLLHAFRDEDMGGGEGGGGGPGPRGSGWLGPWEQQQEGHGQQEGQQGQEEEEEEVLPFELQVLELALDAVCSYLDEEAAALEREAYPVMDSMTRTLTTFILERARRVKNRLTNLIARVQQVRLCAQAAGALAQHAFDSPGGGSSVHTARWSASQAPEPQQQQQQQHSLALRGGGGGGGEGALSPGPLSLGLGAQVGLRLGLGRSTTWSEEEKGGEDDVEDLEMLLEAYFKKVDGSLNRLTALREYIDDTEDYVNILLDYHRNHIYQMQVIAGAVGCISALATAIPGALGMNIPNRVFDDYDAFGWVVGGTIVGCAMIFGAIIVYGRLRQIIVV
eukprot:jgi/Mesen1/8846/ME000053S08252